MKVGLLTLSYRLYAVESIKQKRSIVRHLLAEVQRSGPAFAVCEFAEQENLGRLVLRIAHVSNDPRFSETALMRIQSRLERGRGYETIDAEREIL